MRWRCGYDQDSCRPPRPDHSTDGTLLRQWGDVKSMKESPRTHQDDVSTEVEEVTCLLRSSNGTVHVRYVVARLLKVRTLADVRIFHRI